MSIQALREQLAETNKQAKNLLAENGSKTWTKEDQAKFDNLADESERLTKQIEAHEKMIAKDRDEDFQDIEKFRRQKNANDKKSDAERSMDVFLRKSIGQMTNDEAQVFRNTMSTTTGSEGGFSVQPIVTSQLVNLLKSYGFMRRAAQSLVTENGAALSYPSSDGTAEVGEYVAQNQQASSQDLVLGTVPLNVFKASSKIVTVPIELLQDSQLDIQALVFSRFRDRIGRVGNLKFTQGNGTTEPNGLVTAASVGKTGATGQTMTIIYDDLVDMVDSLDAAYLDVPVSTPEMPGVAPGWMFSQTLRRVLRKIKDSNGRPIWTPSYDAGIGSKATTPDELLGYPVYINNDMPTPAANAKSLAFGNFQKYMIRDAMEMTIFRFDDSVYITKGQIGFLAWARNGGNLLDVNSTKLYQHSAS